MNQPFEHAVIIGCGLLGASLGMALRGQYGGTRLARVVTGVGRKGSSSISVARQRGAIDRVTDNAGLAVRGAAVAGEMAVAPAELVVVCTPVRQFPEVFREIAAALAQGAIVTDVGSTKAQVMEWGRELLPAPPRVHFIGSHPMAGSEKSGPEAARADLYKNGACLVCSPSNADRAARGRVVELWKAVGMRIIECSGEEHDRWTAAVSHLPHAIASTLVKTAAQDPASLETAASGFIDTSRIASGDVTMWTDILMTNRQAVVEVMDQFAARLAALREAVSRGDETAIRASLAAAKETRDAFMARRRALASAQDH